MTREQEIEQAIAEARERASDAGDRAAELRARRLDDDPGADATPDPEAVEAALASAARRADRAEADARISYVRAVQAHLRTADAHERAATLLEARITPDPERARFHRWAAAEERRHAGEPAEPTP